MKKIYKELLMDFIKAQGSIIDEVCWGESQKRARKKLADKIRYYRKHKNDDDKD